MQTHRHTCKHLSAVENVKIRVMYNTMFYQLRPHDSLIEGHLKYCHFCEDRPSWTKYPVRHFTSG